jgi:hypothetical protein
MPILQIDHRVREYEAWKRAFDNDPVGRQEGGVRGYRIARLKDDPNHVVIDLEFDDVDAAEAFAGRLRQLWGRVGDELGLEGPQARVLEPVESAEF